MFRGLVPSLEEPRDMQKMSSKVCLIKKLARRHAVDVSIGAVIAVVAIAVIVPQAVNADIDTGIDLPSDKAVALMIAAMDNQTREFGDLPEAEGAAPRRTFTIPITAFNSEPGQTDATPCIAARGFNLCEHNEEDVVAANFLPMGTKLRIPELYGDRVFTVVDRMNARYYYKMDIWLKSKDDAKQFGVKYATIEVF